MNIDRLKSLAISDSGFIFDPATGSFFSSNSVGVKIINCLKAGKQDREIIDLLHSSYDVPLNELESDVTDLIRSLRDNQLL